MTQDTKDILQGAAMLVPFLVVVYVIGRILAAFTKAKFKRALAPLAPTIAGTLSDEGSGALGGTVDGRTIWVRTSEGVRSHQYPGHSNTKRNLFEIELPQIAGAHEWSIALSVASYGPLEYVIRSSDDATRDRLTNAGVIADVTALNGWIVIRYSSVMKSLSYTEEVTPRLAPTPERFRQQLDLLAHLARVNDAVNALDGGAAPR